MKISVYCKQTGLIKRLVECPIDQIECNVGDECGYVEGHFDPLCHKVDIGTGSVIDHQPPPPSDQHEWNESTKRWVLSEAEQQRLAALANAKKQIEALEAAQLRPLRELTLDKTNADALARVTNIDEQIAALRAVIKANTR